MLDGTAPRTRFLPRPEGVNGAGQTTQLQIILGKLQADSGEVVKAKRNMRIAYLAQVYRASGELQGSYRVATRELGCKLDHPMVSTCESQRAHTHCRSLTLLPPGAPHPRKGFDVVAPWCTTLTAGV